MAGRFYSGPCASLTVAIVARHKTLGNRKELRVCAGSRPKAAAPPSTWPSPLRVNVVQSRQASGLTNDGRLCGLPASPRSGIGQLLGDPAGLPRQRPRPLLRAKTLFKTTLEKYWTLAVPCAPAQLRAVEWLGDTRTWDEPVWTGREKESLG